MAITGKGLGQGQGFTCNMPRIAIVGDVHGHWNSTVDEKALKFLNPDIVLFVGDFGNEDVAIVREISKLNMPKAVILGNHDCWWDGLQNRQRPAFLKYTVPYTVRAQLEALGDTHVGYRRLDFPDLKLSVVGVRPFSLGGGDIFNLPLIKQLYKVKSMEESTKKILELALNVPEGHALVFLGHNGPTGLGSNPEDLCGNDFREDALINDEGDVGDMDLEVALKLNAKHGKNKVPLVVFGHMHDRLLLYHGRRKMVAAGDNGTVYVNTAVVPRVVDEKRNFTVVDMQDNKVSRIAKTWVAVGKDDVKVAKEKVVYSDALNF